MSNFDPGGVDVLVGTGRIAAIQGRCSLLEPQSTVDRYKRLRESGLLTMTYGSLAQGFLTGRYSATSTFDSTDRRHRLSHFSPESWQRHRRILQTLDEVARETGRTPAQVAIRWVIDTGASSAIVVGARSAAQVTENVGALGWSLGIEHVERLAAARRASIQEG